ncbi:MAG: PDZ domain-containing protein [Candidatus Marinimicrobia bacterium]|nr:PDZ domain-containing protein [Candidatus Neomarinimicrobiota bacterium]MCF7839890.1 PDZ domain-containing protein [Candidatus Neomarinimicrobiota bacterium]MCF7902462.1 PDZ domain-containing protein [Candidatus Neomarinimicrobiota bacterium]
MQRKSIGLVIGLTLLGTAFIACAQSATTKSDDQHKIEKKVSIQVTADSSDVVEIVINENGNEKTIRLNKSMLKNLEDLDDILVELSDWDSTREFTFKLPEFGFSRTYLGVSVQRMSSQLRKYFKADGDVGVLVVEVVPESPAEIAGIRAGDVITAVDDEQIKAPADLTAAIGNCDPEDEVTIHLIRNKKPKKVNAVLAARDKPDRSTWYEFKRNNMPRAPHFLPYSHRDDLQKEMDELRKELEALRSEMEKLRKR